MTEQLIATQITRERDKRKKERKTEIIYDKAFRWELLVCGVYLYGLLLLFNTILLHIMHKINFDGVCIPLAHNARTTLFKWEAESGQTHHYYYLEGWMTRRT